MTNNDELALKLKTYIQIGGVRTGLKCDIEALLAEREADKKRIAELEARTVSVKLPKLKMLEEYLAEVAEEERKQIIIGVKLEFHRLCKDASAAAGIKLEAGE